MEAARAPVEAGKQNQSRATMGRCAARSRSHTPSNCPMGTAARQVPIHEPVTANALTAATKMAGGIRRW